MDGDRLQCFPPCLGGKNRSSVGGLDEGFSASAARNEAEGRDWESQSVGRPGPAVSLAP